MLNQIGVDVWALHELALAFPSMPRILRAPDGTPVVNDLFISLFYVLEIQKKSGELLDRNTPVPAGNTVYFTAFPGYQIDSTVHKIDIVFK